MADRKSRTKDYHKQVAEKIIGMLEKGTVPWEKPWDGQGRTPINGKSGKRYRGINYLNLYMKAEEKGYNDPRWMTFRQISEIGGTVRKDEHGMPIEYWIFEEKVKDKDGKQVYDDNGKEVTRELHPPAVIHSVVFNIEQTEGIPLYQRPVHEWEPLERAENIIRANKVPVFHDQDDKNYYSPLKDEIHLTPKNSFPDKEAYYATAIHEVGHSTGHNSRLARNMSGGFGSQSYAKEELRAEIASFMLCNDLDISPDKQNKQHAAYIGSWIEALKDDYNEIFRAAADAEKICDYLYEKEREYMLENNIVYKKNIEKVEEKEEKPMSEKQKTQQAEEAVPATEKQIAYASKLGVKIEEGITKSELSKLISEKLEQDKLYTEKMNAPASKEQIEALKEAGTEIKEGITLSEASKLIRSLPATEIQKEQLEKYKVEFDKDITRGEAGKLIKGKLKEFEERNSQPLSDKQSEYLTKHKIEFDKDITRGEASRIIYKHQKDIEAAKAAPATDKQIEYMSKNDIEVSENITSGEASKLITEEMRSKSAASEKQLEYLNKNGIEIPANITKQSASVIIGGHKRTEDIKNYKPSDKVTISREYKAMAKEMLDKGKTINDKTIAANLLKKGYKKSSVVATLYNYSPNCVMSSKKATEITNTAAAMPSVKKSMSKQAEASR